MSRRAALGLGLVLLLLGVRYDWILALGFVNDDFLFLDHVRALPFLRTLGFADALGNAYRPLSRNVYFWSVERAAGASAPVFHVLNLAAAAAIVVLAFFVLREIVAMGLDEARRGPRTAEGRAPRAGRRGRERPQEAGHPRREAEAPALLGAFLVSLHPAGAAAIAWVAGIQDLLALTFALGATLAHVRGHRVATVVLYAGALLSKETAALLPVFLLVLDLTLRRRTVRAALVRQLPLLAVLGIWLVANRWLPWNDLGRRAAHAARAASAAQATGATETFGGLSGRAVGHALRALVLLEPKAGFAWPYDVVHALAIALGLAGVIALVARLPWPRTTPRAGLWLVALAWIALTTAPLGGASTRIDYYAFFPAVGAALAVSTLVAAAVGRVPSPVPAAAALAFLPAALLVAGAGAVHASRQWDARYIRRASATLGTVRADLFRLHPTLPDGARCYFRNLPHFIGFQSADGPALRVWYRNPTLRGYYLSAYRPPLREPTLFFVADTTGHVWDVVRGLPDTNLAHPPRIYPDALNDLATQLADVGELDAAEVEWRKALSLAPDDPLPLANLGDLLVERRHYAEARALLTRALRADPADLRARLSLAVAEAGLGDLAAAEREVDAVTARAPEGEVADLAARIRAQLAGRRAPVSGTR